MFIYEFKSGNACLVTRIVISVRHIAIYTNKANFQEFNSMQNELNLKSSVSGDHPAHVFCHNQFVEFSAQGDSIPHKHYEFPKDVDRPSYLRKIFNFLINRQKSESLREQDYNAMKANLEAERIDRGDQKFPENVQNAIDTFDVQTPFLPENEIDTVLILFNKYLDDPYASGVEKVSLQAEELLNKYWKVIYGKHIIGFGAEHSKNEQDLCDYYDILLELREALLAKFRPNFPHYIAI